MEIMVSITGFRSSPGEYDSKFCKKKYDQNLIHEDRTRVAVNQKGQNQIFCCGSHDLVKLKYFQ